MGKCCSTQRMRYLYKEMDAKKLKNFKFDLADETSLKLIIVKFNDYLRSK